MSKLTLRTAIDATQEIQDRQGRKTVASYDPQINKEVAVSMLNAWPLSPLSVCVRVWVY